MPPPNINASAVINALVYGYWSGGSNAAITYSIPVPGSTWSGYQPGDPPFRPGFSYVNAMQADAFRAAMELWDSYVAADFVETIDQTSPGTIRIAFSELGGPGAFGIAYPPGPNFNPQGGGPWGDVWFDDGVTSTAFTPGTLDFVGLLHEIGHALGFKHAAENPNPIPAEFANGRYSVMSFDSTPGVRKDFTILPGGAMATAHVTVGALTPMLFDILAIQHLYGADPLTRASDTVYTFDPSVAAVQTIYDAGGIDTLDLTGHLRPSFVDLRPGSFSSIDYYSPAAQIEAMVAQFGEGWRPFIAGQINQADTFTWTDNVAIAFDTIIENVELGAGDDSAIGNDSANVLRGHGGDDVLSGGLGNDLLNGGAGADTLFGGDGDDTYVVDNAGDVTSEVSAGGGLDTVRSSITRTLGANIENLVLTGAAAINGFGNALGNTIVGNGAANQLNGFDGDDTLDGGGGADIMFGGNGDDTYVVDHAGDVTSEVSALGGTDTVLSSVTRNLTANIENLTLTGAAAIAGAGNGLNNIIVGNSAANTLYGFDGDDRLDGAGGADTMFGANGDDTYVVDHAGDITVEGSALGGIDTVESSISRNLNANFENLVLTGSAQFGYGNVLGNVMTGNGAANSLYGFDGADRLDGGAGADNMFGGNGDDTYVVDNAGDVTSEASALGGIDTVESSVTRNLTANLENLVLTGAGAIDGAGNALDNVIVGNSAANTLFGLGGDDTLDGGLGADTLQGGAGADTYVFSSALGAGNIDTIVGFSVADDTIELDSAVFAGLGPGALDAGAFHIGAAATEAAHRIVYDSTTGALWFDADGNGAGAGVQFATLGTGLALTSADFIVVAP